jgi:hypothetical protein
MITLPSRSHSITVAVAEQEICENVAKMNQRRPPDVIVASGTKPGSVVIPEIRDGTQLTLLTVISVFGDSTYPYFISKNKTFEKNSS